MLMGKKIDNVTNNKNCAQLIKEWNSLKNTNRMLLAEE